MAITTSGLASGIDTKSLIAQLVSIQRFPIQKLQLQQSDLGLKSAKISDISAKLKALKTKAEDLNTLGKFLSYQSTVGDSDVLSSSSTGEASPGDYELVVTSLAKGEKNLSAGFASTSSTASAGTLSIAINGGTAKDITINGGDTLSDVVASINAGDAGVNATIINDGLGTATSYKIQLTSKETGYTTAAASDAVTISDTGTGLAFAETIQATNAVFTLDSQPITRTTNTFSDLLTGVNITLKGAGTSSLSVQTDTDAVKEKAQAFVDAYNGAMSLILKELKVSDSTNRSRSLGSEPYIRSLERALDDVVSTAVGTGGTYESLAAIGIKTGTSGTMTLDSDDFETAVTSDPTSVAKIFTTENTGVIASLSSVVDRFTDSLDGVLTTSMSSLSKRTSAISKRIETLENRISTYEKRLRNQFTFMEQTISQIQAQGAQFSATLGL